MSRASRPNHAPPPEDLLRLLQLAALAENWRLGLRLSAQLSQHRESRALAGCAVFHLEYTRALLRAGHPGAARDQLLTAIELWSPVRVFILAEPPLHSLL